MRSLLLLAITSSLCASVVDDLKTHESYRFQAYLCTQGAWTVGYGHRCTQGAQMTLAQAHDALLTDIVTAENGARRIWPSFASHPQQVQDVLVETVFQIGAHGASKFTRFNAAIADRDYQSASRELLASKWAKQTPNRVRFLISKLTP